MAFQFLTTPDVLVKASKHVTRRAVSKIVSPEASFKALQPQLLCLLKPIQNTRANYVAPPLTHLKAKKYINFHVMLEAGMYRLTLLNYKTIPVSVFILNKSHVIINMERVE